MRSPILSLENAISGAAFAIAPERAQELAGQKDLERFSLRMTDERGFAIRVNVSTRVATLPIATLEYLWCCALFFFVLHQEYANAQASGAERLDLNQVPRISVALDLLNWARSNMLGSGVFPWPADKPKPSARLADAGDPHVANEIFLSAIAWIIHHEIAHVRLKHGAMHSVYSIQQERAADLCATDWILKDSTIDAETQKRQLGIVTALLAMQFLDEPKGSNTYVGTHPPSVERLDYCLDAASVNDDSTVCAFALAVFQFHGAHFSIDGILDGTSLRDILNDHMVKFATVGRSLNE